MTWSEVVQMSLAVLSLPTIAAAVAWLGRRSGKESRLLIRVERLAAIFPNLPEGEARDEFAKRVSEAGAELNARLDPLFKQERRRKRKVIVGLLVATAFIVLVFPGRELINSGWSTAASVALGGIAVGAFLLIERDTYRQRQAIKTEQERELAGRHSLPAP